MATLTYTRQQTSPLVEAAISRLPVSERAVKAAEILFNGQLQRIANDPDGADRWAAYGGTSLPYEVSVAGGFCSCPDAHYRAPRDPNRPDRPLCKHMLAAMMAIKLGRTAPASAADLWQDLVAQAQGQAIRLFVEEGWTGTAGQTQTDVLRGYRLPDGSRIELARPRDISIRNFGFWQAVDEAGYRLAAKDRSQNGQHCWTMRKER